MIRYIGTPWPHLLLMQARFIASGIALTLQLLIGGLAIGILLGSLGAIVRYQRAWGTKFLIPLVSVLRGTPLMLQLALVYYALPTLLGLRLSIAAAGILTFGLNSFAYVTEILRAGIESIPKGQFETIKTLNIPPYRGWRDILLPQVLRNVLPAMTGEVISLLKETALIATIGGMDIMRATQVVTATQFAYFTPLCIAGAYYYGLVLFIEYIGRHLEKRGRYA